jgi:SAM-dependent methyltransferase
MLDAMEAEFDTVAEWTAQVCLSLGPEYHLPGACRGSGNPHALDWLIHHLGTRPGDTLLDSGAGVGGPAAYAARSGGICPVLVDPEAGACRAAVRLFGLPVVRASGTALPMADHAVDSAWCLAVLCTTADQVEVLSELHRVVRPGGGIGLLVFVAHRDIAPGEQPEGNHFPDAASLHRMFEAARLAVTGQQLVSGIDGDLTDWHRRSDRVARELRRRYGDTDTWQVANAQSERMTALLESSAVTATLYALAAQ